MPGTPPKGHHGHYKERVVALVDVLGWKDLLSQEHDRPPELACEAIDRLQLEVAAQTSAANSGHCIPGTELTRYELRVQDQFTNYGLSSNLPNEGEFHLSQFSDHLLLSCSTCGHAPILMVERLCNLLWAMLANGILIRGALVVGKLLHSSTIAVGPALVRAHSLESTVAVYPRIVADDVLETVVNHPIWPTVELDCLNGQPLRRDRDGLLFVDFLRRRFIDGKAVDGLGRWRRIRDSLMERRAQHASKPRILSKDDWMISYFNEVVRQGPQLASLEIQLA